MHCLNTLQFRRVGEAKRTERCLERKKMSERVRAEVLKLVREANQRGTTVAFCSHVLSEIEEICGHAAILKRGQVVRNIDLSEVRLVHRVQALIPESHSMASIPDAARIISHEADRIVLEIDGPLDDHLRWLCDGGFQSVQIDSIGLRSIYDSVHPSIPILRGTI